MAEIERELCELRPVFARLVRENGDLMIREYINRILRFQNLSFDKNKIGVIEEIVRSVGLNQNIDTEKLKKQLYLHPVSTAEHYGLLTYELLVCSGIFNILVASLLGDSYAMSLGCNVPLNNISLPGGVYFGDRRIKFYSGLYAESAVSYVHTGVQLKVFGSNCERLLGDQPERVKFLKYIFDEIVDLQTIASESFSYVDQVSLINQKLWPLLFESDFRGELPQYICLCIENLTRELVLQELDRSDSLTSQFLFDPRSRKIVIEEFTGVPFCWGVHQGDFSPFFREVTSLGRICPLRYEGELLVGREIELPFRKEVIVEALSNRRITPTLFFPFMMIVFQAGLTVMGGFNQVEGLKRMQDAFVRAFLQIGRVDETAIFSSRKIEALNCGLQFPLPGKSLLDIIWYYNSDPTSGRFLGNVDRGITREDMNNFLKLSFGECVGPALSEILKVIK